jgi:hypothetical protein
LDHGALELAEHAHHLKERLAGRRRGVEPLLVRRAIRRCSFDYPDVVVCEPGAMTRRGSIARARWCSFSALSVLPPPSGRLVISACGSVNDGGGRERARARVRLKSVAAASR